MSSVEIDSHERHVHSRNIERKRIRSLLDSQKCEVDGKSAVRLEFVTTVECFDVVWYRLQILEDPTDDRLPRRRAGSDRSIPLFADAAPWMQTVFDLNPLLKWIMLKNTAVQITLHGRLSPKSESNARQMLSTVESQAFRDLFSED
jgi:hypothetical protein